MQAIGNLKYQNFGEFYTFLKVDLMNAIETKNVIDQINPDIVIHMAAETHVDRSINHPINFINSNILDF